MTTNNTNEKNEEMPWAEENEPAPVVTPPIQSEAHLMNIYQKINYIADHCPPFKKSRQVLRADGAPDYSSTTFADVLKVINPLMSQVGLTVLPTGSTVKRNNRMTDGHYTYKIVNTDNPSECEFIEVDSQGYDSVDKGANKASTAGMKYLFMRLFRLETEEDPDLISNDVHLNDGYPQHRGQETPAQTMPQSAPPEHPPAHQQQPQQTQPVQPQQQQAPQQQQPINQVAPPLDAATQEHQHEIRGFYDRMKEIERLRIDPVQMIAYLSSQIGTDFSNVEMLPIEPLRLANQTLHNTIQTTNQGNAL